MSADAAAALPHCQDYDLGECRECREYYRCERCATMLAWEEDKWIYRQAEITDFERSIR